jgi:nitrogen fixation protein FixH
MPALILAFFATIIIVNLTDGGIRDPQPDMTGFVVKNSCVASQGIQSQSGRG